MINYYLSSDLLKNPQMYLTKHKIIRVYLRTSAVKNP